MCGIFGFIGTITEQDFSDRLNRINHRGPDGFGIWKNETEKIHIGHRRLAIIDLSEAGKQPMLSQSERYVLSYNGELYNYLELKNQLPQIQFKGHSDTEVLVEYIDKFGIEKTLQDIKGMFAIALCDRGAQKMHLIRDRAGEKPLYYGIQGENFMFGSQLKSFAVGQPQLEISTEAINYYLTLGVIPAPLTIYKSIAKLPPACWVTIQVKTEGFQISQPMPYWNLPLAGKQLLGSEAELIEQTTHLLSESVKGQLVGDVPIGTFLSGGVDSSIIAALAQKQVTQPIKTFSVKFSDPQFDEAPFAKNYADHLKSDHHELYLDEKSLLNYVDDISKYYDEPFSDSSQLPTMAISKLAREHVTVVLSGDAGDELFGGYNRYYFAEKYLKNVLNFPSLASIASRLLERTISPELFESIVNNLGLPYAQPQMKYHKLLKTLGLKNLNQYYHNTVNQWTGNQLLDPESTYMWKVKDTGDWINDLSRADFQGYLHDDVLAKVDRGSMAYSLETRAPFLDQHVIEHAMMIPAQYKVRDGHTKYILKKIREQLYPGLTFNLKKMGFSVPLDKWFHNEMKERLTGELSDKNSLLYKYVSHAEVTSIMTSYYNGAQEHTKSLWSLYVLSQWLKRWA